MERLRAELDQRSATLVSVMAYGGLRPGEARNMDWSDLRDRSVTVNAEKTGQRRSVRLLDALAEDLAAWREEAGSPADGLVFPASDGTVWTANAFEKWRRRCFVPAVTAIGLPDARPYDLRHSFASLLLHEGRSVIYVARQLGHGAELTMGTYGHVIDELEDQPQISAEQAIEEARAAMKERATR